MTDEEVVMKLIVPAGNAKSAAIEAISMARKHDFEQANKLLADAEDSINKAHDNMSSEVRAVLNGEAEESISLVMVHGQDHLMNAITTLDLARQIVGLTRELTEPSNGKEGT